MAAALAAVVVAVSGPGSAAAPDLKKLQLDGLDGREPQDGQLAPPVAIAEDDPLIEGVYSTMFFLPRDAILPLYQPQFFPGKPASLHPGDW